ncbi:MAG: threonine synthase, partial [Chloroflexi bacterium]|nr:threonine synthase [Chloroflexota bacterium]
MSFITHLACPECGQAFDTGKIQTFHVECQSPLLARYDVGAIRAKVDRDEITRRPRGMWRWREVLPVGDPACVITLGEGDGALLHARASGAEIGVPGLFIKDEGTNPTGSFKARGMAAAVSKANELGVREFVAPTAGNAGGALAAYAARGGLRAHIFMPKDAPAVNVAECRAAGAEVILVDGLIDAAGRLAADKAASEGWLDVSTFKEPYRAEGKKIMGCEIAEGFGWQLPDVIIYPTGGGTGLVGMWKAFEELERLGWVSGSRPRMVSVQASGCAPVVRAFESGAETCES